MYLVDTGVDDRVMQLTIAEDGRFHFQEHMALFVSVGAR